MREGITGSGLRYAVATGGRSVAWCALTVRCGTADEGDFPAGIAHFMEHNLFRGTKRRSSSYISSRLDRLGGELNAFTTKEEIVLHATVLKDDLPKAVSLLLELASEASFPDDEVETERGVVLDEIISYKDNPFEDVYDRFEEMLFDGHRLSRSILGTVASVKKITPADLRAYYAKMFIPGRMALTIVAPDDEPSLERLAIKLTEPVFKGGSGEVARPAMTYLAPAPFTKRVDKRNHEVNAVIGGPAPSLFDGEARYPVFLLANILGGPASNSILGRVLREKHGWVYGVECSYTQYSDTGILAISFGCDRPNLEKCLVAIRRQLDRFCSAPMAASSLKAAVRQLLGQMAVSSESGEARCLSMGKSLISYGKVTPSSETRALLEAVTPERLHDAASRILAPEALSSLIFL
ncbi:MAG: insulinase family protein [Bacteroidales bacterium]|nr:insulinase family protein [Bacteroidales bacterium]